VQNLGFEAGTFLKSRKSNIEAIAGMNDAKSNWKELVCVCAC
jgi:hypothetical protein